MIGYEMSGNTKLSVDIPEPKNILDKFQRSKILEIYFARFDGRVPEDISAEYSELYQIDLKVIKNYLLGQRPQDPIIKSLFRIIH